MNLSQLTQHYDFSAKTIIITGGTGVLGREMAAALVGCGANVIILARDEHKADRVLHRLGGIEGAKGQARVIFADVLQRDALSQAEERIRQEFGRIDGLINAAGGNPPAAATRPDRPFFDLPEEALRLAFDLNLLGTVLPCQVFGRTMAAQGEGVILNISSMNAFRPLTRIPAYAAAKAGVSNFTQWLAVHMAQEYSPKIRVNAIAPGFFITDLNRYLLVDAETGELTPRGRSIIAHTPMSRFGEPADLLGAVLWLLSPASAFVAGVVLPVDGGFSAFSGV